MAMYTRLALAVSFLCLIGCGEDQRLRRDKEKRLTDQAEDASRTILHPESDQQLVAAFEKLQAICAEAKSMTPPHSDADWFDFKSRQFQSNADEAKARMAKLATEESMRKQAQDSWSDWLQKQEQAQELAEQARKLADSLPKRFATGKKMTYGVEGGLYYGVEVAGFYDEKNPYCGGIALFVDVTNHGQSPVTVNAWSFILADTDLAYYQPCEAKIISDIDYASITTLNPHGRALILVSFKVPKKPKFYFPIPSRPEDAFVIDKLDMH